MFTYTPHLTVRQPSPTTIKFSVSNGPQGKTLAFRGLSILVLAGRTVLSCATILFLLVKLCCIAVKDNGTVGGLLFMTCPALLETTHQNVQKLALSYPWHVVGPTALAILYACCRRFNTGENRRVCLEATQMLTLLQRSRYWYYNLLAFRLVHLPRPI